MEQRYKAIIENHCEGCCQQRRTSRSFRRWSASSSNKPNQSVFLTGLTHEVPTWPPTDLHGRQLPCYRMRSPGSDVSSRTRGGQRASVRRRYKARFWFTLPGDWSRPVKSRKAANRSQVFARFRPRAKNRVASRQHQHPQHAL